MSYSRTVPIEFNHCDPAGIVFYPRYFEMMNSVVENFFAEAVGWSFARMHTGGARNGVPTVAINCSFMAPSRLGEKVTFTLVATGIGKSSLDVRITAAKDGEVRLASDNTLVWIDQGRAAPWPDEIRTKLTEHLEKRTQNG